MPKKIQIPPNPKNFIESLRRYGYDASTSVADLVDNSITANADNIWIDCYPVEKDHWLSITDDGDGMTPKELIKAMTLGAKDPKKEREGGDLGRFGLGLKTASFSQCRKLTVITKKSNSKPAAACWDLDLIEKDNAWTLIELENSDLKKLPNNLRGIDSHGTQVLWQNIDTIEGETAEETSDDLDERLTGIRQDLSLIFHRFINTSGKKNKGKINIFLNENIIEPTDPFLESNNATQRLHEEIIKKNGKKVHLKAFVLPHHSKLTAKEKKIIEGKKGLTGGQGFYFYREKRLISYGGWQGLQGLKELSKLARVKVDIPNSLDNEWVTRVNKAGMSPPLVVRKAMKKLIDTIAGRSVKVYRQRGRTKIIQEGLMWTKTQKDGSITYQIDLENSKIKELLSDFPKATQKKLLSVLKKIANDLPIEAIYHDYSDKPVELEKGQEEYNIKLEQILKDINENS